MEIQGNSDRNSGSFFQLILTTMLSVGGLYACIHYLIEDYHTNRWLGVILFSIGIIAIVVVSWIYWKRNMEKN